MADKNKLTVAEFNEINERRSQDDMAALLAHVQADLGIEDPPAEPSHSDAVTPANVEPQTVVAIQAAPVAPQPAAKGATLPKKRARSSR